MTIGEIHWVELPDSGGSEHAGRRPAIILQNDMYAASLPSMETILSE
jgi:mRNA-degrading endonuclease toxin of MazEF toxin-antitoxin module